MNFADFPLRCSAALARHMRPDFFKALCDPQRLALVAELAVAGGPATVSALAEASRVHLSGVSRHLAVLRRAGIVRATKRGREVHYSLEAAQLVSLLRGLADAVEDCCQPKEESA